MEEEMVTRDPELAALLEQSRQRRIDSMALRSRFDQDEERFIYPGQAKFGSLEKASPSSSTPRMERRSLKAQNPVSATTSPILRARDSSNDMIFDMEDDPSKGTPSKNRRLSSASLITPEISSLPQGLYVTSPKNANIGAAAGTSHPDDEDAVFSPSLGNDRNLKGLNIANTKGKEPMIPSSTTVPPKMTAPWDSAKFQSSKVDMKEILAQTPSTRTSNISLGMAAKKERRSSGNFSAKLSQKERKKLQQQYQQEAKTTTEPRHSITTRVASETIPKPPWQTPQKGQSKAVLSNETQPRPPNLSIPSRGLSKTSLTMRQTIPGNASPKPLVQTHVENIPTSSQRPTSSGRSATTPPAFLPARPQHNSPTPIIQSVRHTPLPNPSNTSIQLSMADILAQQQSEKDTIKEVATAKRSLQDIQQEQEFQEWWDQESAKVQAEQEAADAAAKGSASSRGRGKGRGRGRGRGRGGGPGGAPAGEGRERGKGRGGDAGAPRGGKGRG
jgi:inhibitor of Bruton tyrosine kinase